MNRVRSSLVRAATVALLSVVAVAAQSEAPAIAPKQALAEARALAAQAKGKKGLERAAALEAGAKAYLHVAATFQADAGVAAEASFEAGELWRRKGALPEAESAYRAALEQDPARYEARASLELAHLLRRGKKFAAAVDLYQRVATLQPGSARAQAAALWVGRTWQAAGKLDDAIAAFASAVRSASSAAAVIDAGNWLAKARLRKGDRDGARAAIAEVEKRTENDVAGDTPAAKHVQALLADMTARKALQRALDKATGAADDAVDVDGLDEDDDKSEEDVKEEGKPEKGPAKNDRRPATGKRGR